MSTPEVPTSASPARLGAVHRWRAVLRSEIRKTTSVRMYWLLLNESMGALGATRTQP